MNRASRISNSPAIADCSRRSMEEAPPRHLPRLDAMPEDALYEILLRLPAKDLCRLRSVCRPWRSLLSDPHFIAARHPELLVVVGYDVATARNDSVLCDIVDLSGHVVKRVHAAAAAAAGDDDDGGLGTNKQWVMSTQGDLICVTKGYGMSCQLLNPATGAVHDLPDGLAAGHAPHGHYLSPDSCWGSFVFGLVPSTGEYKVHRMIEGRYDYYTNMKLYEVLTLNGSPDEARWRREQAPPYHLELSCHNNGVVISGIVYFLLSDYYWNYLPDKDLVGSFDLETEEWMPSIRGPSSSCHYETWHDFKITTLNGHLVLCCRKRSSSLASPAMGIWFLRDFDKGSCWVKQHSIKISVLHVRNLAAPLLVLTDGRIASRNENWAFLQNYNYQQIDTSIDVLQMKNVAVGLYGGNLLSLANGIS